MSKLDDRARMMVSFLPTLRWADDWCSVSDVATDVRCPIPYEQTGRPVRDHERQCAQVKRALVRAERLGLVESKRQGNVLYFRATEHSS